MFEVSCWISVWKSQPLKLLRVIHFSSLHILQILDQELILLPFSKYPLLCRLFQPLLLFSKNKIYHLKYLRKHLISGHFRSLTETDFSTQQRFNHSSSSILKIHCLFLVIFFLNEDILSFTFKRLSDHRLLNSFFNFVSVAFPYIEMYFILVWNALIVSRVVPFLG